jgi:poly-gamma-glutamate capsule biosynthesis protein CapA/YwtB (metallophosphatase superfamily)
MEPSPIPRLSVSWRDSALILFALVLAAFTLWAMGAWWRLPRYDIDPSGSVLRTASSTGSEITESHVACGESSVPIAAEQDSTIPEEKKATTSIRLLFVGDLMLDRNVGARSRAAGDLSYPFRHLPTDWISSFDYAVANLEGPITALRRPPEKSIDFQFDPKMITVLKEQGFDAFSQANNHALDQGHQGYADSVSALRRAGFLVFGHQVQDGEIALATTTIKGKTFAFVGWNTTDNPIDLKQAEGVLKTIRPQVDYVIAMMHWGAEYQDRPLPAVVSLTNWLVDHGVDIVVGGHPHWVQGLEDVDRHPAAYSLGNFVFDQDWSRETQQGLALALTIEDEKITVEPIPLAIEKSQPRIVIGAEREARLKALARISNPMLEQEILAGSVAYTLHDDHDHEEE